MTETLIVAVIGAAVALSVAWLGAFAQRRLVDRTARRTRLERWDSRRLEAFANYAGAVKQLLTLSLNLSKTTLKLGDSLNPITIREAKPRLDVAEMARASYWEQVLLLGEDATIVRARTWQDAVWAFQRIAQGQTKVTKEQFDTAFKACDTARRAFYDSARLELGISEAAKVTRSPIALLRRIQARRKSP